MKTLFSLEKIAATAQCPKFTNHSFFFLMSEPVLQEWQCFFAKQVGSGQARAARPATNAADLETPCIVLASITCQSCARALHQELSRAPAIDFARKTFHCLWEPTSY